MDKGSVEEVQAAHPDAELQTDKDTGKIVVCTVADCGQEIIANVFYAPAKAKCTEHGWVDSASGGGGGRSRGSNDNQVASLGVVQAGRTDPAKAVNLVDCLLNKALAETYCPFDPTHDMELKSVSHNPNYGPSRRVGFDSKGNPKYKNDIGETVMHQCNDCKTIVSMTTTAQHVYSRMNEMKPNAGVEPRPLLVDPR